MALTTKDVEYHEYERDQIAGAKQRMLKVSMTLEAEHIYTGITLSKATEVEEEKEIKKNLYLSIVKYLYADLDEPFNKLSELVLKNITDDAEQDEVIELMTTISEIIGGGVKDEIH